MIGKVIVVEGLDGAGKSLAIDSIRAELESQNRKCVVLQEPGSSVLGSMLRTYVKSPDTPELDNQSEILLFFLSRSVLVNEQIIPLIANGTTVILDRFYRTTVAYQGFGHYAESGKLDNLNMIRELISNLNLDVLIDLELYLDIPVSISRERTKARGVPCQIETRPDSFFEAARRGYLTDAEHCDYIHTVDATQSIGYVADAVKTIIQKHL